MEMMIIRAEAIHKSNYVNQIPMKMILKSPILQILEIQKIHKTLF